MDCPRCGKRAREGTSYCTRCGTRLAPPPPGMAPIEASRDTAQAPPMPPPPSLAPLAKGQTGCRTATVIALGIATTVLIACNALLLIVSIPNMFGLALSVVGALVPAAFYSALVLRIDRHEREPWSIVLGAFGWGALVAALVASLVNTLSASMLGELFAVVVSAPLVEESAKGIALLLLLVLVRAEFDNVLDGLLYGALIGMGFELMEDVMYLGSAYLEGGVTRFGAEWFLRPVLTGSAHALFTGTTGAAVGWARGRHGRGALRFIVPVIGWCLAVLQHFLWNTGALTFANALSEGQPAVVQLVIQVLLLLVPALVVLYTVARISRRREIQIIREYLADEVARGVLTPREYDLLSNEGSRREALAAARRHGGRTGRDMQRQFFQAAAELAFRKYHLSRGEKYKRASAQAPEDNYRAQLAAARTQLANVRAGGASRA